MALTAKQINRAKTIKRGRIAATAEMTDAQASNAPDLYPVMQYSGIAIASGTIINWNGQLKRAAVTLWDREDNDPASAPGLWEDIAYKDGIRIIPDTITATTAFAKGELGYWHGSDAAQAGVYRAKADGTVWTPQAHAAAWEYVEAGV